MSHQRTLGWLTFYNREVSICFKKWYIKQTYRTDTI